jgi:hypothetical protein
MADLSGVRLKLERASFHLADFDRQAMAVTFELRKAIRWDQPSIEKDWRFWFETVPTVPSMLSAILGDAVHNVRSALDYLAYQLVKANGIEPDDHTQFPIYNVRKKLPDITPGVPLELRNLLDELQPYQFTHPRNHALEVLHRLSIADKHHESFVAAASTNSAGWFGDLEMFALNQGPYKPGDVLCWVRTPYDDAPSPSFMFKVRFDEPEAGAIGTVMSASEIVRMSIKYIDEEVLTRFKPWLIEADATG